MRGRWLIIFLLVLSFIASGAGTWASFAQVKASQHRWCKVLVTLDDADQAALKAPPSLRPKGAYSFALITGFHDLRQEFCG